MHSQVRSPVMCQELQHQERLNESRSGHSDEQNILHMYYTCDTALHPHLEMKDPWFGGWFRWCVAARTGQLAGGVAGLAGAATVGGLQGRELRYLLPPVGPCCPVFQNLCVHLPTCRPTSCTCICVMSWAMAGRNNWQ